MNLKEIRKINESYHEADKLQKKVITPKNYTYRVLVSVLDKYIKGKKEVLDLGSGVGTLDFYLALKGKKIIGVDESLIAVNMAKNNSQVLDVDKNITYIRKNILNYKSEKKFDAVLLFEVIEHLPDDKKALVLTKGLLKKEGLLFLSTRSINAPLSRIGLTRKHDERVGHLRRYTLGGLRKKLEDLNFKIIYKTKTEGFSKELLFSYPFGAPIIRAANKFAVVSDVLNFIDILLLKLFGESQIIIVAKKI